MNPRHPQQLHGNDYDQKHLFRKQRYGDPGLVLRRDCGADPHENPRVHEARQQSLGKRRVRFHEEAQRKIKDPMKWEASDKARDVRAWKHCKPKEPFLAASHERPPLLMTACNRHPETVETSMAR